MMREREREGGSACYLGVMNSDLGGESLEGVEESQSLRVSPRAAISKTHCNSVFDQINSKIP